LASIQDFKEGTDDKRKKPYHKGVKKLKTQGESAGGHPNNFGGKKDVEKNPKV